MITAIRELATPAAPDSVLQEWISIIYDAMRRMRYSNEPSGRLAAGARWARTAFLDAAEAHRARQALAQDRAWLEARSKKRRKKRV